MDSTQVTSRPDALLEALHASRRFSVLRENIEGANARAFHAINEHLQRPVFLKVYDYLDGMHHEMLHEPRILVNATNSPGSPHLVQIYEAEILEVDNLKYLCLQMEHIAGESLLSVVNSHSVGVQDAIRLITGVLNGVLHLHSKRILHRDLKPANILLHGNIAKITDFGSARILADGSDSVSASRHSAIYVPPEGYCTPSRYSAKSDIYQCALVLYELINGPFEYDGRHYLLPRQIKDLQRAKKNIADLEPFELCQLENEGIAERANKQKLAEHGRKPEPYMPRTLARLISAATAPDENRRLDGSEFLRRLAAISTPNWRRTSYNQIECEAWSGWDWRIQESPKGIEVGRSHIGQNNYRRYNSLGEFDNFATAANAVADLK